MIGLIYFLIRILVNFSKGEAFFFYKSTKSSRIHQFTILLLPNNTLAQ